MEVALTLPIWLAMISPVMEFALTDAMSLEVSVPVMLDDDVTAVQVPDEFW